MPSSIPVFGEVAVQLAELILKFLAVLVWPAVAFAIFCLIRTQVVRLLEGLIEAKNIEFEIVGQKVKIEKIAQIEKIEKSVETTIREGIERSKSESTEDLEQYVKSNAELVAELSVLDRDELSVLSYISDNPGIHTKGNMASLSWYGSFKSGYSMITRILRALRERELVRREMVKGSYLYFVTPKGKDLLLLAEKSNRDSAAERDA
jgi:DNA-binding MarR family transcriptional regulator